MSRFTHSKLTKYVVLRPLSPQPANLKPAQEPASKDSVKTAVAVPVISSSVIQSPNITQALPALSALAARSVPLRVSTIVSPPTVKSDVKPDCVNNAIDEEERDDCDATEERADPNETVEDTKSSKRRKVSSKKVVSQEFIESDEDSRNEATPSTEEPSKEEGASDPVAPSAAEEESGLNTNVHEELLTPSKIKENSNSSKKTDEDLDVSQNSH